MQDSGRDSKPGVGARNIRPETGIIDQAGNILVTQAAYRAATARAARTCRCERFAMPHRPDQCAG